MSQCIQFSILIRLGFKSYCRFFCLAHKSNFLCICWRSLFEVFSLFQAVGFSITDTCCSKCRLSTRHWWLNNRDSLFRTCYRRIGKRAWFCTVPWLIWRIRRWCLTLACWVCWTCRCRSTDRRMSAWYRRIAWPQFQVWTVSRVLSHKHYFSLRRLRWSTFRTSLTFYRSRYSCNCNRTKTVLF